MQLAPRAQIHLRDVLTNLTLRQLRTTYKDSALGFGWSLINPVVTILVYSAVFTLILRGRGVTGDPSGLDEYGLFLAAGLLPWQFTQTSITAGSDSLLGGAGLLQKMYLPRWILPASSLLANVVTFMIELLVLVVLLAAIWQAWAFQFIPLILLVVLLNGVFIFGLSLALAPLNVYYRDIGHVLTLVLRLWFWLTPIIYPLQLIAEQEKTLLGIDVVDIWEMNPMLWFISAYQQLLFDLRVPSFGTFMVMTMCAVGAVAIGAPIYRRLNPRLVDRL